MKRPLLFAELCAGTAAVSLKLQGGRHARPPVSRMGSLLAVVRLHVLAVAGEQLQIFDPIIGAVAVDVVNNLPRLKRAPKVQRHDHPMLPDAVACSDHLWEWEVRRSGTDDVARVIDSTATLPPRGIAAGDVPAQHLPRWRRRPDSCGLVLAAHQRIAAGFRAGRAGAFALWARREGLTTSGAINRWAGALLGVGAGLCVALLGAELLLKAAGERPATVGAVLSLHTLSIA